MIYQYDIYVWKVVGTMCTYATSLKRQSWSQQHRRGPISGQLSARATGTFQREREIPWTWHQEQLEERVGFLVSRSLTLSSAHV